MSAYTAPVDAEINSRLSCCPFILLPHLEGSSGAVLPACLWRPFHKPRKWTEMCPCSDNTFLRHEPSVLALPLCSLVPSPQPQLFPLPVWEPRDGSKATCSFVCTCCPCSAFLPPGTTSFIWNGPFKAGPTSSPGEPSHGQRPLQPHIPILASAPRLSMSRGHLSHVPGHHRCVGRRTDAQGLACVSHAC